MKVMNFSEKKITVTGEQIEQLHMALIGIGKASDSQQKTVNLPMSIAAWRTKSLNAISKAGKLLDLDFKSINDSHREMSKSYQQYIVYNVKMDEENKPILGQDGKPIMESGWSDEEKKKEYEEVSIAFDYEGKIKAAYEKEYELEIYPIKASVMDKIPVAATFLTLSPSTNQTVEHNPDYSILYDLIYTNN
jgi:hypothetical protein